MMKDTWYLEEDQDGIPPIFELLLPFGLFENLVAFLTFGLLVAFKVLFEDLDALVPLESFFTVRRALVAFIAARSSSNRRREQMTLIP